MNAFKSIAVSFLALLVLISGTFLLIVSRDLRLISDDYCAAFAVQSNGFIGFVWDQYQVWTGAFIAAVANSTLGTWLTIFPEAWSYGSWVLFSLFVAIAVIYVLMRNLTSWQSVRLRLVFLAVGLVAYMGFVLGQFGIPSEMGDINFAYGYMWLGWIAAGLSQIIPGLLFILAATLMFEYRDRHERPVLYLAVLLAFILGQFNFVSALALSIYCFVTGIIALRTKRIMPLAEVYVFFAAVGGALVNFLSPGTRNRASIVSEGNDLFAFDYVSGSLKSIIDSVFSDSIFLAGLLGIFLGLVLTSIRGRRVYKLFTSVLLMFLSTLVATFIIENLAFPEPWHYALVSINSYLLVFIMAIGAGSALRVSISSTSKVRALITGVGIVLTLIFAVQAWFVNTQIQARTFAWSKGEDASVFFIADRETAWIAQCWQGIDKTRS